MTQWPKSLLLVIRGCLAIGVADGWLRREVLTELGHVMKLDQNSCW